MSKKQIFAVIYRGYIQSGKEDRYVECWKTIASYFVAERGALGSTLHKTSEGMWIAYSKWPDRATRDASWPKLGEEANFELPAHIRQAIEGLKGCFNTEETFPEICMELIEEICSRQE